MFSKGLNQFMGRSRGNRSSLCNGGRSLRGTDVQSCVCPKCGYTVAHERGVPCRSMSCPHCHVPLIPDGQMASDLEGRGGFGNAHHYGTSFFSGGSNTSNKQMNTSEGIGNKNQKDLKEKKTPAVNQDLCVGCGSCVDACPHGAIEVVDSCAVIDADKCKGCGKCIRVCPANAISF